VLEDRDDPPAVAALQSQGYRLYAVTTVDDRCHLGDAVARLAHSHAPDPRPVRRPQAA
jgi:hypothetical protein